MITSEQLKHTPGPWSVPHFARPNVGCQCGYVLCSGLFGAVATVHCSGKGSAVDTGDNPEFEEAVSNAYLIAAAPELYEAAKMLESLMNNWGDDFRIQAKDLGATMVAGEMIEKFKAALALAEKVAGE